MNLSFHILRFLRLRVTDSIRPMLKANIEFFESSFFVDTNVIILRN